jgi:O-antigen/teichoic acid export membrane protein
MMPEEIIEQKENQSSGALWIARDSLFGYAGTFLMLALGFLTKILLARILSSSDLGLLLTGQAIVGLALVLSQLSLPEAAVRFVALFIPDLARARSALISALRVAIPLGIVAALGLTAVANLIGGDVYHQPALVRLLVILAIGLPFTTIGDVLAGAARGVGKLWIKVVVGDLARAAWVVLLLCGMLGLGIHSVYLIGAGYLSAAVLSGLVLSIWWLQSPLRLSGQTMRFSSRELLAYSLPLLGAGLLTGPVVNSILPLFLAGVVSPQAVAYFNLAGAFTVFVNAPVAAVEQAALPFWSKPGADLRATYALSTRWCLVLSLILFAPLMLASDMLMLAFYPPEYVSAAPLVRIMAGMALFSVATGPNAGMLKAIGRTRWILFSQIIFVVALLISTPLLLKSYGVLGAAMAWGAACGPWSARGRCWNRARIA